MNNYRAEGFVSPRAPRAGRRWACILGVACALAAAPAGLLQTARAADPLVGDIPDIVTSDIRADTGANIVINLQVGADRFYDNGYFGSYAAIANVEAGHIWNGQEMLGNVTTFINDPSLGTDPATRQYDYHATMVGGILAGLGPFTPGVGYYYFQFGMAPTATLWSTAIATAWVGTQGQFDTTQQTFDYGYVTTMQTGALRPLIPGSGIMVQRPADVINSSWGFDDPAGTAQETETIDGLAYQNHQTVVIAAGNHTTTDAQVTGPASGFNVIAVAALQSDLSTPAYGQRADFSNGLPNDFFNPQTGQTIPGVRPGVDISAPGTDMVLPAYLGATGTNSSGALFSTAGLDPSTLNQYYFSGAAGTSFAAPVVAGGAALVVDAGYQNFGTAAAVDGRVIKAVLLNSADKLPGWSNNEQMINGVVITNQALDFALGAGALDLNRAYDQYLSGTTDLPGLTGGTVRTIGWDYAHVAPNQPQKYFIDTPMLAGDTLTATLAWFVERTFDSTTSVAQDLRFDNLFLEVWLVQNGQFTTMVAESDTIYDNVQHLFFNLPTDGYYGIEVVYGGAIYNLDTTTPLGTDYALAWQVPEPATLSVLLIIGVGGLLRRGRRDCRAR